jgi:DNA-binding CsgD family transcriptional regulator
MEGHDQPAMSALWVGLHLLLRGEKGQAAGWLARAQRLLEREERDCVEHGYLLLPVVWQHILARDWEAGYITAARAAEISERFNEKDLTACARHLQGRIRIHQGHVSEGLALLDEMMLPVIAGELSPLVTGFIYWNAIDSCRRIYALDRVSEWTQAWARWRKVQRETVAFTDDCAMHRAEMLYLSGAWADAIEETRAFSQTAAAFYLRADMHRLRGELPEAEEAYRGASRLGGDPQPGLALLRTAQGRIDAASASIRRSLIATTDRLKRVRLLPAYIEIMLAAGANCEAREASRELEETARTFGTEVLSGMAASARGAVELAEGNAPAALRSLRYALHVWQKFRVPYMVARVRLLAALACSALEDSDGYELELAAARNSFETLGAAFDLARLDSLARRALADQRSGLTPRELQVLRLVAGGNTNKAIAAVLGVSEKTIDRHVSNIFVKLGVSSRAAATAFAYEHHLIGPTSGAEIEGIKAAG